MIRSSRHLASALLVAALAAVAVPPAAWAQSDRQEPASPTQRLQEGAVAIIDGLRLLLDQLQGYQAPEVLPNGDIIIRRRPPAEPSPPPPSTDTPPAPENKPQPL